MPVTYALEGRLLRLDLVGEYSPEEVPKAFLAALADPACPRLVALLLDVTRSRSLAGRAPGELRAVSEFIGPYAERVGGRCAVVAPSDVLFGMSQMGAVFSEAVGVSARVFRTHPEALQWLGLGESGGVAPTQPPAG